MMVVSKLIVDYRVPPSVGEVFALDDVNAALQKLRNGGSKGKTILKIA